MDEKSEEQIAKERAAVESMRNAKANMDAALSRISSLEGTLRSARSNIESFKRYVPSGVYPFKSEKSVHNFMDEAIAAITKAIGPA
jgi:multidrug resistance efflux pump